MTDGYFIGIDFGTSSVKTLAVYRNGEIKKTRCAYVSADVSSFKRSLKKALFELFKIIPKEKISAIGFSSQVGTYILDDGTIIPWNSPAGKAETDEIKEKVTPDEFINEISFPHPNIISYPLPRLLHIKKHYPNAVTALMPKEYFIREFTGQTVTDVFSQRGIANQVTKKYSDKLIEKFGLEKFVLPPVKAPTDKAGEVTENAEREYGVLKGVPVYLGCNDFYAGLIGMGVLNKNDVFDLSGTSEHVGAITENPMFDRFVSTPFLSGYATYGGTKGSGVCCSFALDNFDCKAIEKLSGANEIKDFLKTEPPIFLPYPTGERAPIFDENARGVFFGISDKTDKAAMAYSVFEGVVFSVYDIYSKLGVSCNDYLVCAGGSADNRLIAALKAILFNKKILLCNETDVSALGAAIIAAVGNGNHETIEEACRKTVKRSLFEIEKCDEARKILLERFAIYKDVYKNLKNDFVRFAKTNDETQTIKEATI